jgi:hypothetical protein
MKEILVTAFTRFVDQFIIALTDFVSILMQNFGFLHSLTWIDVSGKKKSQEFVLIYIFDFRNSFQ